MQQPQKHYITTASLYTVNNYINITNIVTCYNLEKNAS